MAHVNMPIAAAPVPELTKAQLRARVRTLFPAHSAQALDAADRAIERNLVTLLDKLGLRGACVGGYQPIRRSSFQEPAIDWTLCGRGMDMTVAFPLVDKGKMVYRDADGQLCKPDVLVVPAVGYDSRGYRLGHGAGNFDQYLAVHSVRATIGVVYAWQLIKSIPTDAWDQPVQWVVTDDGILPMPASERSHTGRN